MLVLFKALYIVVYSNNQKTQVLIEYIIDLAGLLKVILLLVLYY